MEEGIVVCNPYSELLNVKVQLRICADSKDLFSSLLTQKLTIGKSHRGGVSSTRYESQTGAMSQMSWIPGTTNIANSLTQKDSPLTDAVQLTLLLESGQATTPENSDI